MTATVTNIQRYSVNDGYGIRTIVFLSGCSMRCIWCQNPETLGSGAPVVMLTADSCAGCGACQAVCPSGAIANESGAVAFDRDRCTSCFTCVGVCYFNARKVSARRTSVDRVFAEVMKDEAFFRNSGGGLTISGGEPLLQPTFCRELLLWVKDAGIHTAVETAGNVPAKNMAAVAPYTDLFLFDIKLMDDAKHRRATGVSNALPRKNLESLVRTGVEIIVRVPLIPGVNDGAEFDAIADFVASHKELEEIHILPYHTLGVSKYVQLGLPYPAGHVDENNDEEVQRAAAYAATKGLKVSVGGAGFESRACTTASLA